MTENKVRRCYFCGNEGVLGDDIHEEMTYLSGSQLYDYMWACKSHDDCLDRQIEKGLKPSYYRTTAQVKEQERKRDFKAYCSIAKRNVDILSDCQSCKTDCLGVHSEQERAIQKQKEITDALIFNMGIKDAWQREVGR